MRSILYIEYVKFIIFLLGGGEQNLMKLLPAVILAAHMESTGQFNLSKNKILNRNKKNGVFLLI